MLLFLNQFVEAQSMFWRSSKVGPGPGGEILLMAEIMWFRKDLGIKFLQIFACWLFGYLGECGSFVLAKAVLL